MNKIIIVVILVVGIFWFMNRSTREASRSIVVPLSTQNSSGMSGTATLTEINGGGTLVALNLIGTPNGVSQPAHIHSASCANIGGVAYPLEFLVNGVSETTLNVSLDGLLGQLPLAINVHKSATEASVYVACGDIKM